MPERSYDLLIRHARLRGKGEDLFDIGINAGCVNAIEKRVKGAAKEEIDAEVNLTTESFVNTHLQLCKVWSLDKMDEVALRDYHGEGMGKAMTAIERARPVSYTHLTLPTSDLV